MKVLKKRKKYIIKRKKEKSLVRGYELGILSSLSLEEENRSNLRINIQSILDKANSSQRVSEGHSYRDRSLLSQWIPKGD